MASLDTRSPSCLYVTVRPEQIIAGLSPYKATARSKKWVRTSGTFILPSPQAYILENS
ncbi:hypothetical protein B4109_0563 [Geobacillus stearothermophilus]|uniref:Uncharacterized protein n=1 Tax=Geobacillus stearothermophilus TaxID=1422 RepID=A0A150MRX4_GEOSE|nr:hypothetical protein B4109_0563 [Geobacillus stearothermophilus]